MNQTVLHHVSSQSLALDMCDKLGKLSDTGGRQCFTTDICPISSKPRKKVYRIAFLPDMYAKLKPGFGKPNTDILAGFVRGVLAATGQR